jgi:hypothetical protein
MQIPTNFSAAQAVSIASVVSSRDKNSVQAAATTDAASIQTQLQKSESASPDRDAQGQGDGLGHHAGKQHNEDAIANDSLSNQPASTLPPDEPPALLDLVC